MAEAKFNVNQSHRKFTGSLDVIHHEIDVLHRMYESLQVQHTETEAELKRAQERIEFLEVESASNVNQAVQIINSGAINDASLTTRLNKIYDSLEAWALTIMPIGTDLSEKWPSISQYLAANCLIQPGNTTFNMYFKGTNPELVSAIIMAVLLKMLFLNAVAGMLPDQALVLRQLQNSISLVQPYKSAVSLSLWQVESVRAWMQSPNFQAQLSSGCFYTLSMIKEILRMMMEIQGDIWDQRFRNLLDHVIIPAAQLATEIQRSGTRYQWRWYRFGQTAGLKFLEEFQVTDFKTRYQVKEELVRDLPESTRLGTLVMITLPGVYRVDKANSDRVLLVKHRVLARTNDAIRIHPRDTGCGLFEGPDPIGKTVMEN
ncbi:uncharacterized protein N7503_001045 [Penicillium pulvis]|uniref:uncharacterized protein n=1 Tax=Penicillium pulvis TaxID=1562058 RepID=UPI0025484D98|nr:uncharacterized protein N7503_001045 [Penicillium pulvis]KAJ5814295.1 hypothetical protein N7503_001045 [Penicillium pulvis]